MAGIEQIGPSRRAAVLGVLLFGNLAIASSAARAADDVPGQSPPAWIHSRSDPFAKRVEELVAAGMPREAAEGQARQELIPAGATECLAYTFVVIWCEDGALRRAYKRIESNCIDDIASTSGCTPLTCPPGWAPPAPCPLPPCPAPRVPMWDTLVVPSCAGLPSAVGCVWMYPTAPTPSRGPCDGVLTCACFPEIDGSCQTLFVECRNPSAPRQEGDLCPDCQQD